MKIDLLVAENRYGSTLHFAKGLSRALEKQGVKTRLFWVGDGEFHHAFYTISADPPDCTLSFSDITLGEALLGDLWEIPHLSILVDPAIYSLHQLKSPYSRIACVDEKDVDFLHSLHFAHVFSLPHAVESMEPTPPEGERVYETVFFGSCIDYEYLSSGWSSQLWEAADLVLSPKGISILEALRAVGIADEDLPLCHHQLDLYARGKDRVEILKRLDRPHIWGDGPWKKYCLHAHIHSSVPFEQTLSILKQSQWLINSSVRFKSGLHERILYATLCGCGVLTGENACVWDDLLTYRHGEWELPAFTEREARVLKAQQHVLEHHTWDQRAATLITYFGCRNRTRGTL